MALFLILFFFFFFIAKIKNMDIFRKKVSRIMSVPFFFHNYVPNVSNLSPNEREYALMNLDYVIQYTKFYVKIYYYAFVHLVKQNTMDMIEVIKSNRILRYSGWRTEAVSVNHSNCCVSITVCSY